MAKYFESTIVFKYNWDQVAQGFWKRYPNPHSGHVMSEDTLIREIRDGNLYTKRLLTKTNRVPKWGERFFSAKSVKIVEESIVDPKSKVLVTYTANMGYAKVMSVVEKVVYRVSKDNADQTVAVRSAWIDSQVFGFSRAIKAFGVERFRSNCNKMVSGFNHVLHAMFPNHQQLCETQGHAQMSVTAAAKLKEAAKNASDLAKAKAENIYNNYSVKS